MGRSKELIISGGEHVYPAELENVLADCPQIAESAVLGIEDAKWGEAACAVVVRKRGAQLDEAAVLALFEDRLARFKHPRRVVFVDQLPKNALGKVQKSELRNSSRTQVTCSSIAPERPARIPVGRRLSGISRSRGCR